MAIDGGLRPLFRTKLKRFFWVAVETPISGGGVPDHYWCCDGVMGWNEYKQTTGSKVKFRTEQPGWHLSHDRHGGRSFIIVRQKVKAQDIIHIFKGSNIIRVRDEGLYFAPGLYMCAGGPSKWDWGIIEATLLAKN